MHASMRRDPLQNISIVLVRSQSAGNIGSACRAMKNMGLSSLILVAPEEDPLSLEARMMATSAKDVLEKARICQTLGEALLGFRWIVATSARRGKNRGPFISPREISPEIIDHAWSIPVAIIFGPEDHGLSNEELAPCHALISVPTHRRLSSLNLAQAVMLVGYELYLASLSEMRNVECGMRAEPRKVQGSPALHVVQDGIRNPSEIRGADFGMRNEPELGKAARGRKRARRAEVVFSPEMPAPLAEFQKVEKMYAQMEELLLRIGFLNPKNPKRIMHTLRRVFGRAKLSDRDVAILRGVFRQLDWYATHYNDSKKSGLP